MPVINHQSIPEVEMRPGIRGQFLASKGQGARGVCRLVNTADPGTTMPLHKHSVEETMLVLEGIVCVQGGGERHTIGPSHTVSIPAEAPHAWGNAGGNTAKLLWAFVGLDPCRDSTYFEGLAPACMAPDSGDARYQSVLRTLATLMISHLF